MTILKICGGRENEKKIEVLLPEEEILLSLRKKTFQRPSAGGGGYYERGSWEKIIFSSPQIIYGRPRPNVTFLDIILYFTLNILDDPHVLFHMKYSDNKIWHQIPSCCSRFDDSLVGLDITFYRVWPADGCETVNTEIRVPTASYKSYNENMFHF